jgi:hypothetical protein
MNDRLHSLVRIREGDYCLLANDNETLWRISRYEETGLAEYQDADGKWHKITGSFWQTAKYRGTVDVLADPEHVNWDAFLDWDSWDHWAGGFARRKDAVADIVR